MEQDIQCACNGHTGGKNMGGMDHVNQWHTWQPDIEYAKLDGEFKVGNTFRLKPKAGPGVSIEIVKVEADRQFTDLTRFPGARMFGCHEFIAHGDALEIRTTMSIEGFLSLTYGEKSLRRM